MLCSGLSYSQNQNISQIKPAAPVNIKASCQPQVKAIHGTTNGAITAPTFVPALNIPVANALSFFGNHSATVFIAAGKFPASKKPNTNLAKPNPKTVLANACPIAAKLQPVNADE